MQGAHDNLAGIPYLAGACKVLDEITHPEHEYMTSVVV